jgi:hypothetical protein
MQLTGRSPARQVARGMPAVPRRSAHRVGSPARQVARGMPAVRVVARYFFQS